jgi:hypothetical protein
MQTVTRIIFIILLFGVSAAVRIEGYDGIIIIIVIVVTVPWLFVPSRK